MSEPDNRKQALQNPNQSWIQNYRDYTGQKGTLSERNSFKKDYVSKENVDARMGLGTYDKLREEAIQLLFGTKGYNTGTKGEQRRFDRRFNRNLRKGKLLPRSTIEPITQTNTISTNGKVIYPALWGVYNIKPRGFLFNSQFLNSGIGNNPELRTGAELDTITALNLREEKTMQNEHLIGQTSDFVSSGTENSPELKPKTDAEPDNLTQFAYLQRRRNEHFIGPIPDFASPGIYFDIVGPSPLIKHSSYGNLDYTTTPTSDVNIQNLFDFDKFTEENNLYKVIEKNGKKYLRYDPLGIGDFYVGLDGLIYLSGMFGELGQVLTKEGNKVVFPDGNTFASLGKYLNEFNKLLNIMNPYIIKNKQGGKMNKINYFQQGGKNLPTAPDAKEAYKGGTYKDGLFKDIITGPSVVDNVSRTLIQKINPVSNDTTYIETPSYDPIIRITKPRGRKASSSDKDRTEYEILNRRFNEGASVVNDTVQTGPKRTMLEIKPYLQQGGTMNQQQDIQQQVIQLVQAAMLGDQKATDTVNQIMQAAQQGDQQAIQLAQMIKQVVEQMKGQATMAKWGSKLGYIRSLKYAKGGKTCPSCQNGGKPLQTPLVKKSTEKVEEKACGGKAKKRYFGGYI